MKEISRESLHSSIKSKSKEIQDKFLDVANTLIRKGSNVSYAIQEANKTIIRFEEELALNAIAKQQEEQVQINGSRYIPKGTKFRFYIWGDSTVTLKSTDLPGTTSGTVTLPAFRLNIA